MEKKRPQLNLHELYQLKWILGGVLALLSAWTVLYMEVEATLWLLLITAAVPVVQLWPALTLKIPRWGHRLAFPLFVALFATDFYFNGEPLPAMIRLALMLVFYRTVTPRKRRDDLQLLLLGLFLVVIAGVLSVSIAFAFQIVAFTACALVFLLLVTLIDSAEADQATSIQPRQSSWLRRDWSRLAQRVREATDWRVTALACGLFAGVVGLSALLFFALPRFEVGGNFFLDNLISGKSQTGFGENVRFGDVTDIKQDNSIALRVQVSDPRAIPFSPYWRMLILDSYENGLFSASDDLRDQLVTQRRKAMTVPGSLRPRANDAVWVFYLEPGVSRYLPLLGSFRQLSFDGGAQDYAINDELRLMRLERAPPKMFAYRVEGMRMEPALGKVEVNQHRDAPLPRGPVDEESTRLHRPAAMPNFLKITLSETDTAKLAEWAKPLDVSPGDSQAFARAAMAWLAKNHAYSLQMSLGPGEGDELVRWIESSQPGHCELFAGAFTMLARAAGYPARMVTGFRGGTWNADTGHLNIRNSDAHAWCEILDNASQTWMRVDPTPGGDPPGSQPELVNVEEHLRSISDSGFSSKLDGLRMLWYRRIVDFDQTSQVEIARGMKKAIEDRAKVIKEAFQLRLKAIVDWLREPWDVWRLGGWAASVVLGVSLVVGWKRAGRGWWLHWRSGMTRSGPDPVRREAGRWLRRMAERGAAAGAQVRSDADWRSVREELERLRYGARSSWPNPQGAFRRAKRECRRRR